MKEPNITAIGFACPRCCCVTDAKNPLVPYFWSGRDEICTECTIEVDELKKENDIGHNNG